MLRQSPSVDTDPGASDNTGVGILSDLVTWFVWSCVAVAVLLAVIGLLHAIGRRRAAERDAESPW